RAGAARHGFGPQRWRGEAALGALYASQRRHADAHAAFAAARAIIAELADGVPDPALREQFVAAATARLPPPRPPPALRAAKAAHGGLTAREREVAALIARGMTNRGIAGALSTSERTITSHVSNILNKLGYASRSQIAAWAAGRVQSGPH